jgi:cell division ATPase FtsA
MHRPVIIHMIQGQKSIIKNFVAACARASVMVKNFFFDSPMIFYITL